MTRATGLLLRVTSVVFVLAAGIFVEAAQPSTRPSTRATSTQPDYPVPYVIPKIQQIEMTLEAVKGQIELRAMTTLTTRPSTAPSDPNAPQRFALISYPMGVIYSGMLSAADATGDRSFADFDAGRFKLFAGAIARADMSRLCAGAAETSFLCLARAVSTIAARLARPRPRPPRRHRARPHGGDQSHQQFHQPPPASPQRRHAGASPSGTRFALGR